MTRRRTRPEHFSWENATDEELLRIRICDLDVRIEGSPLVDRINQLYAELEARGLRFRPPCYLTTEWLSPDLVPLIGIPFCLAHPRLIALERTMMLEVEGETEKECMQLLRHEAGHAINYAYKLYRRTRWRELFGPMSSEYDPHSYQQTPYSRNYVLHLKDNYAQAHPDEDFAETFATWLTPGIDWHTRYKGWGALKKLEYVDKLMVSIGDRPPLLKDGEELWPAAKTRSTLESYYKKKRREFAEAYPGYYDPILRSLFTENPETGVEPADHVLRRHRKQLTRMISKWALVRKYAADELIRRLATRAGELKLFLRGDEKDALVPISICLTSLVLEARAGRKETVDDT